jgi:hypothetical protein
LKTNRKGDRVEHVRGEESESKIEILAIPEIPLKFSKVQPSPPNPPIVGNTKIVRK